MIRKKRILFRGFYNFYNFGDDLVLIAWNDFLSSKLKYTNEKLELYTIQRDKSSTKLNFDNQLSLDHQEPPDITSYINEKFKRFHVALKIPNTIELIEGMKRWLLTSIVIIDTAVYKISRKSFFIKEYLDFLSSLDVIHYIGGGYFTDRWNAVLVYEFFLVLLAKNVNSDLKIIGTGLGLGPFKNRLSRIVFKFFAKNFDYLFVRDDISLKLLEDLKVGVCADTLGDDAILLFPFIEDIKQKQNVYSNNRIAFNLKSFPDHDYFLIKRNIENYLRCMRLQNCKIEYFCFGKKPGPDDRKLMEILDEELRKDLSIHDPYEEGWTSFIENLAQTAVGLGFAYHFSVILTLLGIPVVSVYSGGYYRQKMEGGIKFLNKDSTVLSIGELTSVNIAEIASAAKSLKHNNMDGELEMKYKKMALEYAGVYENILK
ncbi:MAG: polysaccharide pyruvyl transferase family protein [Candidatus Omnitrophica bacterium]|nr:polysaccharide pyruvyl transferase family protein [Candidatus Omnitrophota bacterium]